MHINNEDGFQLGDWWVEPMANRLDKDGETVTVEPRVMELLVFLAQRAGTVVGPEEIFGQVWQGVVVGDNALHRCVAQIRKVLGDSAAEPRYIATVPKRGYRLIAEIHRVPPSATAEETPKPRAEAATDESANAIGGAQSNRRLLGALIGGLALVAFAFGTYVLLQDNTAREADGRTDKRLTSIAVLPFVNVSNEPANDFFAVGLSDEILNTLSQVEGLDVVARTSAYSVESAADVREIGRRLNVEGVVEGTVRRSGNKIRVNVQLIDAATGFDMWSAEYDRNLVDVFAVQEEIAESLLTALSMERDIALNVDVPMPKKAELQAFDLYLLGRHYTRTREPRDLVRAVAMFRSAIRQDQAYAPAYAGLAEAHLLEAEYGDLSLEQAVELAEPMIDKALSLDERLAEGYAARGLSRFYQGRHKEAQAALRATIDLNASHALANMWLGLSLAYDEGRIDESQRYYERAERLDPLNVTLALNIAYNLSRLGRYAEALERLEAASERHPDSVWVQLGIAQVAADFGRFHLSHEAAERALELRPDSARAMTMLAYAAANVGQLSAAEHWIERTIRSGAPTSHWHLYVAQGAVYLQRGNFENLNYFLEKLAGQWFEPDPVLFFSPQLWQAHGAAGTGRLLARDYAEAAEHFERYLLSIGDHHVTQLSEDVVFFLGDFAFVSSQLGAKETFQSTLAEAVAVAAEAREHGWNTNLLTFYEARLRVLEGDDEAALATLKQAVDEGYAIHWWVEHDPVWDSLRSNEVFQELSERMERILADSRRGIGNTGDT